MVPRFGSTCRRRWRCFSATSRHVAPSSTWTRYALDTNPPRPRPIAPDRMPIRKRIPRACLGSRFFTRILGRLCPADLEKVAPLRHGRKRDHALGGGGLHAEQGARYDLDAFRSLVARRLYLEHSLDFTQARLFGPRSPEFVPDGHDPAAKREVKHERQHGRHRREGPEKDERPRSPHV